MKFPTLKQINKELAERSFYEFVKQAWDYISPDKFVDGQHIKVICDELQLAAEGKTTRLLINICPGLSKSTLCSIMFPSWLWINQPWHRIIIGSHSFNLATNEFNLKARNLIQSPWFQENWGDKFSLRIDSNAKDFFSNNKLGERRVTSPDAKVIGFSASLIILDDCNDPKDNTPAALAKVSTWYEETLYQRLRNPDTGIIIVIQQRVNVNDLSGHLIPKGTFKHINLPAIYEKSSANSYDWRSTEGEIISSRYNQEFLDERRKSLGSRVFGAQFQQHPTNPGGNVIKDSWLRYYHTMPEKFTTIVQSWDLTFGGDKNSDHVVGQVWGKIGANCYLIDQVRGQWDFVQTIKEIRNLTSRYPQATTKLIESAANGKAAIATLRNEISGIIPVVASKNKLDRLNAVEPAFEAGNIYLPSNAQWIDIYTSELTSFTGTSADKADDQVDATSQALTRLLGNANKIARVSSYI